MTHQNKFDNIQCEPQDDQLVCETDNNIVELSGGSHADGWEGVTMACPSNQTGEETVKGIMNELKGERFTTKPTSKQALQNIGCKEIKHKKENRIHIENDYHLVVNRTSVIGHHKTEEDIKNQIQDEWSKE